MAVVNYDRESRLSAMPPQRRIPAEQIGDISRRIRDVVEAERDNYNPKNDHRVATFLKVATVISVFVIAVLALASIHFGIGLAIAAGVSAAALGLALGGVSYYLSGVAQEREDDAERVREVHEHAICHRVGEAVDEFEEVEMAPQYRGRRAAQQQGGVQRPRRRRQFARDDVAPRPAAQAREPDLALELEDVGL